MIKTFNEADSKFDTYMLNYGTDLSGEQKTRTKAMWEVALENLLKANDRKERLGEKKGTTVWYLILQYWNLLF